MRTMIDTCQEFPNFLSLLVGCSLPPPLPFKEREGGEKEKER
jgi:hypothetical protein